MIIMMWTNGYKYCYRDNYETIWENNYGPNFLKSNGHKVYGQNNKYHNIHGPSVIYKNVEKSII